ncbi:acyl carrier protein [Chitinophaga pendula]|uniref:phosphopantetheine-binding protein n=1 Tax=Chitinophaga TaxID=79328 RepID=UPI000BB038D0|nr:MULTISPECIES: phosphopantetheine-binding protein [Chitinophaga]ASZ14643.1 hypothetical protein CK934_28665 [Chitinophaga sp. MD30]UCJ07704.1 acyl carrier protein [Chitinophaga pendula]
MKEAIRSYLQQRIGEDVSFSNTDDIFELGLVTSIFAMQLVMYLEREFNISVSNDEMNITNFNSVDNITTFVSGKKSSATTANV